MEEVSSWGRWIAKYPLGAPSPFAPDTPERLMYVVAIAQEHALLPSLAAEVLA